MGLHFGRLFNKCIWSPCWERDQPIAVSTLSKTHRQNLLSVNEAQGDQIGRIFAHWAILWAVSLIAAAAQIFRAAFSYGKKVMH
jgi:hypothetical protein